MKDWNARRAEIVADAFRAHPMAVNDIDALARVVSNNEHAIRERNEALNLNASQARKIARLEGRVSEIAAELAWYKAALEAVQEALPPQPGLMRKRLAERAAAIREEPTE